jgi:hypothetical protein
MGIDAMDHRTIDAECVAERYVTGRLSPEEAARFEEHYLDCPACCSRIEAAERLERGLRRLAEQAAGGIAPESRFASWGRSPRLAWAAAAVLVAALVPAVLELRQVRELRRDLAGSRGELALARAERPPLPGADRAAAVERELQATRRDLAAATAARENLAQEIAADRRPQARLPVLPLTPVRGGGVSGASGGGPVRTLVLPRRPGWVALWVEPGDDEFPAYRATLLDARGKAVFRESGLALNDLGALLLAFHSTTLAAGSYRLEIDGLPPGGGAPVAIARFPLRLTAGS